MSRFDEEPDGDPHGECAAEIRKLVKANDDLEDKLRTRSECAHCVGVAFRGYGRDAKDYGLCTEHAQALCVNYEILLDELRRIHRNSNATLARVEAP